MQSTERGGLWALGGALHVRERWEAEPACARRGRAGHAVGDEVEREVVLRDGLISAIVSVKRQARDSPLGATDASPAGLNSAPPGQHHHSRGIGFGVIFVFERSAELGQVGNGRLPSALCPLRQSSWSGGGSSGRSRSSRCSPAAAEEAKQHVEGDEAESDFPVVGGEGGEYGSYLAWGDKRQGRLISEERSERNEQGNGTDGRSDF